MPTEKTAFEEAIERANFAEILPESRKRSVLMVLDFNEIERINSGSIPLKQHEDIQRYFIECGIRGIDPKLPENRQAFNNIFLDESGSMYLIGRYGEDRVRMLEGSSIAKEGRTIHLGLDLFCKNLEPVFTPDNGEVIIAGREPGSHSFGHYVVIEHILVVQPLVKLPEHHAHPVLKLIRQHANYYMDNTFEVVCILGKKIRLTENN